jgi:DNA primase
MPRIAEATIREIHNRLDAETVMGEYVHLEKRNGGLWGLCPFHQEKTPSFKVDPDKKSYYCFGCHEGGGIVNFVMQMDKLSYPEALEDLAKRLGIEIIYESGESSEKAGEEGKKRDELSELYRRVADTFHHFLTERPEGRAALDYILSRDIRREIVEKFRLGYSPPDRYWLFKFLKSKGYSPEFLGKSGLFSRKYPEMAFFSGRLMFPIGDRQGRTVAFGGRILGEGEPKYLNSPESAIYKKGETLFAIDLALPAIRIQKSAYIAEGYMDIIALHQAGISNAVAPLGTAFTPEQARLLRRWVSGVSLLFDSDKAGQKAAAKAILTCRQNNLSSSVVNLVIPGPGESDADYGDRTGNLTIPQGEQPNPKDPADILKIYGEKVLQRRVKNFILDFDYLMNRSKNLYDLSNSDGKAQAAAFCFPYLEALDSEIERDARFNDLAGLLGVDRRAIQEDYRRKKTAPEQNRTIPDKKPQRSIKMTDELFLLSAVLINAAFYPRLRSSLELEDFGDSDARQLYISLEEWYRAGTQGLEELLGRIDSEALKNFVTARITSNEFDLNPEKLVQDGIRRVKQKGMERRRNRILTEIRIAGQAGTNLEDLLYEKVQIDAELERFKEATE